MILNDFASVTIIVVVVVSLFLFLQRAVDQLEIVAHTYV